MKDKTLSYHTDSLKRAIDSNMFFLERSKNENGGVGLVFDYFDGKILVSFLTGFKKIGFMYEIEPCFETDVKDWLKNMFNDLNIKLYYKRDDFYNNLKSTRKRNDLLKALKG